MSINPNELEKIGIALFGKSWKNSLAEALDIDPRTLRYWMDGTNKPKHGVINDLLKITIERRNCLNELIEDMQNYSHN